MLLIVWDAIKGLGLHRSALWPALIIPGIGIIVTDWLFQYLAAGGLRSMAVWLLKLPVYVLFAVSCHRVIILGRSYLPNRFGVYWTWRETVFLGWLVGLGLLAAVLSLAISIGQLSLAEWHDIAVVTWVTDFFLFLLGGYFIMRFALVLPAAALEHRVTFRDSWAVTRGNGLALAIAISIPTYLATLLYEALDIVFVDSEAILASLPYFIVSLIETAVHIAIMSIAYKYLVFVSPNEGGAR